MDVMMAIVFGGMPLSGGAYSKIIAGIIGSFSMVLLSQIMTMVGVSARPRPVEAAGEHKPVYLRLTQAERERLERMERERGGSC